MLKVITLLAAVFGAGLAVYDWSPVDQLFAKGILNKAFPGAVVLVGNATSAIFQNAYGTFTYRHNMYEFPVRNDTMYDVASLTKTIGTTAAIMGLLESKFISLDDKVVKYFPIYKNGGKENTTISNLLLHNSGLLYDYPGPLPPVFEEFATYLSYVKPAYPIGSKWSYSNLGFYILGEIIKNITGRTLGDYYHQRLVFMSLKETVFNPDASYFYRITPTEYDTELRKRIVRAEPHERLSYYMGGETGHSGLFSTATDVTQFMRLMLNLGKIGVNARVFMASTVEKFISRVEGLPYESTRGYGKT